jgi:hypothetical protein
MAANVMCGLGRHDWQTHNTHGAGAVGNVCAVRKERDYHQPVGSTSFSATSRATRAAPQTQSNPRHTRALAVDDDMTSVE